MTHINVLDPGASPLDYYGFELRRHREAAGLAEQPGVEGRAAAATAHATSPV